MYELATASQMLPEWAQIMFMYFVICIFCLVSTGEKIIVYVDKCIIWRMFLLAGGKLNPLLACISLSKALNLLFRQLHSMCENGLESCLVGLVGYANEGTELSL